MSDLPVDPPLEAIDNVAVAPVSDGFARRALLRRLMDVVALPASRASVQDRAIAGDLLLEMLIESDVAARELCARRLQEMSQAPKRLLRFLALDAPHVALIILAENKAFDDSDLSYVVAKGSTPHRVCVAARRDIGPAVASAIADSGDPQAMKTLLENSTAKLSEHAIDVMIGASRKSSFLVPLLSQREETRPAHALVMFWWASAAERKQILMRFSADRLMLIDGCADIFRYAAEEGWKDPVVRKALQVIERRQRNRAALDRSSHESLEAAVQAAAVTGLDHAQMTEISHLSGIKPLTGEKIFADRGGEGMAVLCKATGLKRASLRDLWTSLRREGDHAEADFARISEVYETLAVVKAQTVLRYWNWSLSSAFSPESIDGGDVMFDDSDRPVGTSQRSAQLVFGR
ncbi:MAG: DUF2336 domain-containing protein [Alphaproteobacteria bacterium]